MMGAWGLFSFWGSFSLSFTSYVQARFCAVSGDLADKCRTVKGRTVPYICHDKCQLVVEVFDTRRGIGF